MTEESRHAVLTMCGPHGCTVVFANGEYEHVPRLDFGAGANPDVAEDSGVEPAIETAPRGELDA